MTERQARQIIDRWIPRLGLQNWRIDFTVEEFQPTTNAACCKRTTHYNQAVIVAQTWLLDKDPPIRASWRFIEPMTNKDIEATLVHELLHCAFAPLGRSVEMMYPGLKDKEYKILIEAYDNAQETIIEQLAQNLVASFGDNK